MNQVNIHIADQERGMFAPNYRISYEFNGTRKTIECCIWGTGLLDELDRGHFDPLIPYVASDLYCSNQWTEPNPVVTLYDQDGQYLGKYRLSMRTTPEYKWRKMEDT